MAKTQEVEVSNARFTDGELAALETFEDVKTLFANAGVNVALVSDYGTGFTILENKDLLVGVPFIVIEALFNDGDYGVFVSCAVMTRDGKKLILNDGSSGIMQQLQMIVAQRKEKGEAAPNRGIMADNGLTRSDFYYNADLKLTSTKKPDGEGWAPASTYYLA